jgi:hypothetical protein
MSALVFLPRNAGLVPWFLGDVRQLHLRCRTVSSRRELPFAAFIPLMIFEYLTVGKPVSGDATQIPCEARAVVVRSEDNATVTDVISDLATNPGRWVAMTQTVRRHVEKRYDRVALAGEYRKAPDAAGRLR